MTKENFLNIIEFVLLLIIVVLPIRFFLLEPFLVKGLSMEPNFHNFDYLIVDKLTYFLREPKRGEVVVFKPPFNDRVYYIKRVIGLPLERLILEESKIIIFNKDNPKGFVLNEDYVQNHYTFGKIEVTLGPNEYFVLGDNREVSYDSRKWGPVQKDRIIGRVVFQASLVKLVQALNK
jgi:signal peptidase I